MPVNEYGLILPDQPVLVGLGSNKPGADVSLWEGDQVAFVVAESGNGRGAGVRAHSYRVGATADRDRCPRGHARRRWCCSAQQGTNILKHYRIRKGDMRAAWAAADVIVEGTYHLPYQEHAYLQPEAGVGYIDDEGRITVEFAGQWTHEDQHEVAHALGVPADQVRVIYRAIGGAFGGREDMSLQIVLGLAAMRLREQGILRPVRVIWTRAESIIGHHKRHPAWITTKWGATADGEF